MGGTEGADSFLADGRALDYQQTGPTVVRMLVGAQLRNLREASGISREDAGYAIRASHSKISRLELGRTSFKSRDVADLLTLYGVTGEAERATLLTLAEQANTPGWWQRYSDVVPSWFESYLGLEQAASIIRTYEVQFVPGLLQTPDYAREVIRLGHPDASRTEIERRVSLRISRAQILHRPDASNLWAVIDEAALRRPIGDSATMRAQLEHLIYIAELPHVTVQLLPFSVGGHAAAGGPITILRFPQADLPDVVYLEQLISALYLDKPEDTYQYGHLMNRLAIEAEQPAATQRILRQILKES
jgi:transcriptional regulator with XRE-family HTH domain